MTQIPDPASFTEAITTARGAAMQRGLLQGVVISGGVVLLGLLVLSVLAPATPEQSQRSSCS
jgi:hypothetical protein